MSTQYNRAQQALIDAPIDRKVVGSSGAGTGKTTTVIARIKRILNEYQTGRVLMITFTRNAANDMRRRLYATTPDHLANRVIVGTFHSVLGKLIRQHAVEVGLQPTFSVIDENSTTTMYRSIIEENPAHLQVANDWFGEKLQKKHFNTMAASVSTLVNTSLPHELMDGKFGEETRNFMLKSHDDITEDNVDSIMTMLHEVFKASLAEGRFTNTVNYDHIIFIGYLMCMSGLLKPFADSLIHMIVDEYQDTNHLQDVFVRTVGGEHLTLIGDVDQAIYGFRGGKAKLLEDHAAEATLINLTQNYRSYQPILDSANELIAINTSGSSIRKPLEANRAMDGDYGGILVVETEKDMDESRWVIERIKLLMARGVQPSDIAILVRSRTAMASINMELGKQKIPVNDTTKFADFMASDVMVDTLNFLKMYTNPKDIYAFLAVLDRPKRGIGAVSIKKLQEKARSHDMGIMEYLMSSFISELTPALYANVESFITIYKRIIENDTQMGLHELVDYLHDTTGYKDWLMGLKNHEKHTRNLETLSNFIDDFVEDYELSHGKYSLFDIANAFTFEMTASTRQEDKEGIVIATMHGAKGLEWDHVFIIGMDEEIFPGGRIVDLEDMESERRLAYVAFTRAKCSLTLTTSESRIAMNGRALTPSSFLDEAKMTRRIRA